MIAAAIGLLVVALVLLLVGIAKSSVAPLVLSVIATVGACGLLAAAFAYYRRAAAAGGDAEVVVAPAAVATTNGAQPGLVPGNWDLLGDDAAAALARTFGFDELQAARAHEVAHGYRRAVLDAIDERLEVVVTTRRRVG